MILEELFKKSLPITRKGKVMQRGVAGEWDDYAVKGPSVVFDVSLNRYVAMYEGRDGTGEIGRAESLDGETWSKYAGNPVLTGTAGKFDEWQAFSPCLIIDAGIYRMWYTGIDAAVTGYRIGYATSTDNGYTWTKQNNGNPVLVATSGKFDAAICHSPSVLKIGTTFHIWYTGSPSMEPKTYKIGYAISSDGITWTKQNNGNPVLDVGNSWDKDHVLQPCVLYIDGMYYMFYTGINIGLSGSYAVGVAKSDDGIGWIKSCCNPIFIRALQNTDAPVTGFASVEYNSDEDKLRIWYHGGDPEYDIYLIEITS